MRNEDVKREEVFYRQLMLYYEVFNLKSRKKVLDENPWHWHEEFEVCLVKEGKVKYKTTAKEQILTKGDVVFLNSKTIHALEPIPPCDDLFISVHFFNDVFVSGGRGNSVDVKYIYPIQTNEYIDMIYYKAGTKEAEQAAKIIEENIILKRDKSLFWEFDLRKNVCDFWRLIYNTVNENEIVVEYPTGANKQLREAISFIQKNYQKKITLTDIAGSVHISTRGCDRMFNKYLQMSPIMYLHSVRLQKATSMLSDMNKSIAEVAMENGYAGSSHFGKIFKEQHNMTPKEYREKLYPGENNER